MILNVDFTDLFFSFNLARLFNAVALVEATQTIKVESIIVNILPAIFLLIFFVYLSKFILWLFSEKEDSRTLRRCYSYMIGNYFILIGIVSAGYEHVVKPLASISWWLGLPIHTITMMPLIGVLVPFNALLQIASLKNGFNLKGYFARTIAYIVPFLLLMLFMKILGGSPYLMNYMKVK